MAYQDKSIKRKQRALTLCQSALWSSLYR